MSAPSGIVWGDIVDNYGRIGIYTSVSSTNTESTISIEVWFWSKYGCSDEWNSFYFDNNTTSATTKIGNVKIAIPGKSGAGWYDWAQVKIGGPYTYTYSRGTSNKVFNCAAKLKDIDSVDGIMTCTTSYTVPALASYTISYNANGGSGAPPSQTKWYGSNIVISTTKPTRTGYSFQGWGTSSSDTSVDYAAGATYSNNASITLYAIWKANTYTVSYNANGGSGAPSSQTKTYGVTLALSSTVPTRTNYNFKGWATSSSATSAAYSAGGSYTANAAVTLYAVWELAYVKPRITNIQVFRSNSSGTASEDGTYFKVSFSWATDKTVSSVKVQWKKTSDTSWTSYTASASGTSGTVTQTLGSNAISTEFSYNIQIIVTDSIDSTTIGKTIPGKSYPIDFRYGGKGVAIGKPAEKDGFEVAMVTDFNAYTKLNNTINTVGYYRFNTEWIGFYSSSANAQSSTARKGWMGFDGTNNFTVSNGTGGSNITNVAWTTSSDKRLKKNIEDIPEVLIDIWKELQPKVFKWNELNSSNDKYHFGLIAQDVVEVFKKHNLDYKDYGFVNSFTLPDDDTEYFGIAYDEYHMLTSAVLKETNIKLDHQQELINSLQAQINELKNLITK